MTYDNLIQHFGTPAAAAAALAVHRGVSQISRQAVHYWKANGIPRGVQAEFQIITGGRLQADRATA